MSDFFKHVAPSECNIDYHNLMNFAKRLENQDIPMHSLTIMRGDKICMETIMHHMKKILCIVCSL